MDNKDIDRAFRREELKEKYTKPLIVFAIIAIGLFILFVATPVPVEHKFELVKGKTVNVIPASEGYGYDSAMIVLLENGQEARVPIKKGIEFKEDKSIEIKKISSEDTSSYEFSRYLKE